MIKVILSAFIALTFISCNSASPKVEAKAKVAEKPQQDISIFKTSNVDGKITPTTIEKAFETSGFSIDGNNNMNKPFSKRFGSTWYKTYHLFTFHDPDMVAKLVEQYPSVGLITPLSMSIYSDKNGTTMSISSPSLRGMSRMTQIPMTNPVLVAFADKVEKALKLALPNGKFQTLNYKKVADLNRSLETTFETEFECAGGDCEDDIDAFQDEFEGEMEPLGFLFPGYIGVNDEIIDRGVDTFDFYNTYSVCKLEVIHPVSKVHPEVGAFAPCTFYFYKKKNEKIVHMGFPSVQNWILSTDMEDDYSIKPLIKAQNLFKKTVNSIIE